MKTLFSLIFFFIALVSQAQHSLEKIWETDTTLNIPESVLFDKDGLYIALTTDHPWGAEGRGGIARANKNGKITNATWTTGLNAPKGMGIWNKKLYVADISAVVVVNAATGAVESRIPVEGAKGLNDVTIDGKGAVYVSDSQLGNVHKIVNGKVELFMSDLKGINGLKAVGNELYMLTEKNVFKTGPDKKKVSVAPMEIGGDGIEPVGNGDYLISCWVGLIYYMDKTGKMEKMLDTRDQKKSTADIGYDPSQRMVYVPTFFKKSVVAYKLK